MDDRRRAFNDDRRRLFSGSSEIVFVCECSDPGCRYSVVLEPEAFDRARTEPPHVLLHEQHRAAS